MLESNITALEAIAVPTAVEPKSNAFISPTTTVAPSRIFSSAAVLVTPSKILSSAVVEVTPSSILSSSGVEVICVVDAAANTGRVPDTLGKPIVLSPVGSTTVSVVSCASAVAPSKIIALEASIVTVSTVVVVPATVRLGTSSCPVLGLYRKAPVSSNNAFDSSWNTTGKLVFAVLSVTVVVAANVAFATVVPAITLAKAVPLTVIASASKVPSISALPEISSVAASNSPLMVMFLPPLMSLFESVTIALLAITVPFVIPSIRLMSVALAVTPSKMLSSAAVEVTPSKIFNSAVVTVAPSRMLSSAAVDVVARLTAPLETVKSSELNEATPLLDVLASSPAIVIVLLEAEVSIPSPPAIVNVSLSKSIAIVPLSVVASKSCTVT